MAPAARPPTTEDTGVPQDRAKGILPARRSSGQGVRAGIVAARWRFTSRDGARPTSLERMQDEKPPAPRKRAPKAKAVPKRSASNAGSKKAAATPAAVPKPPDKAAAAPARTQAAAPQ